jgi:hypothetical protein
MGYAVTFVGALVMGAVTSLLVRRLGVVSLVDGLFLGLVIAGGYVGTSFMSNYIFGQRSAKLFFIDAGYQTLAIIVAFAIATSNTC